MSTTTPNNHTDTEMQVPVPTKGFGMADRENAFTSPMPMQTLDEDREPSASMTMSPASTPPAQARENEQTDKERRDQARREEEESIALARAMMAEEAMAVSYAMSQDYLRHNRDQFSDEDLAALQAAMDDDQEEVEEFEEFEEGEDGMSYELMLRLGERLGDVKTERWSRVAKEKINSLPTFQFDPKAACDKDENDCEVKCLVCQFPYEKEECLRRLPCQHCFHSECVDQWLMSKDCCPYCRTAIVEE